MENFREVIHTTANRDEIFLYNLTDSHLLNIIKRRVKIVLEANQYLDTVNKRKKSSAYDQLYRTQNLKKEYEEARDLCYGDMHYYIAEASMRGIITEDLRLGIQEMYYYTKQMFIPSIDNSEIEDLF